MKTKFLTLVFGITIAVSALVIGKAYAYSSYGNTVNTACAPEIVFTGDCTLCHTTSSKSDPTPAKDAFLAGGSTLTDYFCPTPIVVDNDGDGYATEVDCNDSDATINPGAVENCNDGIDNNCNGLVDNADPTAVGCVVDPSLLDTDNDGFTPAEGDCNDNNDLIYPGAVEICTDWIDNDCNGYIDIQDANAVGCPVVCIDTDGDGYATNGGECGAIDCNDTNSFINPAISENCTDGIDNDCDSAIDCSDRDCLGNVACLAATCADYNDRNSCKADTRCTYSGKNKACLELPAEQVLCKEQGGRWNKKKESCIVR